MCSDKLRKVRNPIALYLYLPPDNIPGQSGSDLHAWPIDRPADFGHHLLKSGIFGSPTAFKGVPLHFRIKYILRFRADLQSYSTILSTTSSIWGGWGLVRSSLRAGRSLPGSLYARYSAQFVYSRLMVFHQAIAVDGGTVAFGCRLVGGYEFLSVSPAFENGFEFVAA